VNDGGGQESGLGPAEASLVAAFPSSAKHKLKRKIYEKNISTVVTRGGGLRVRARHDSEHEEDQSNPPTDRVLTRRVETGSN
jgi:hypothetical protein